MTDYSRSNGVLSPFFEEAALFLEALAGKDEPCTFQTFDDVKGRNDANLVRVYQSTFNQRKAELAELNQRGGGVFVVINQTDLIGHKKENIVKVRAVWIDMDGAPIQPVLDLPEDLQPHIIIETSPNKYHAYWLVDNCTLEQFPYIQRTLAAKFDGDISVNNINRVMRLAGFSHNKGESFITRIHTLQNNLYPYSVNKLIVGLGLDVGAPKKQKQTFANANTGTFDNSSNSTHSRDFETVKRAAQGRWDAILSHFGISLPPHNKHTPCPACGGTDRFRYDNQDGHGTFICNQGGNGILSGDGFALIQHKTSATSSEVLNMVRGIVMPDYQKSEKYQSASGGDDKEQDIELPDPIPLRKTLSDVMPFTEGLLPPALSHFAFDEADRMPAAPSFVGTSLVTALGSVIGAGCGIKPKQNDDWLIVTNLWGGIVANPTQKKTPAIDSGMRILSCIITEAITNYEVELKQYKKDVLSYDTDLDGLKSELKSSVNPNAKKPPKHTKEELVDLICKMEEDAPRPPMLRRYKTNDSTVPKLGELEQANPNGILVLRDELIGLLSSLDKEGNEGDRAFYLEGFNGTGSYDTDRIGRGHIFIPNHCLSVFGGIQPDKLIAYLEQAYSGLGNDGLLQRFQLLVYPDPIEWQYRDRHPNKEAFKAVLEIFSRLKESDFIELGAHPIDEYNKRPYFRFTLDAQAFYVDWTYQLNAQKIPYEENAIIQQHLGKYDRLLPALALIFHLVDCVSNNTQGQVGLESIKRAALWCEYLETHARRIYGLLLDGGMKSAIALSNKLSQIVKSANRPTAKTAETSEDWLNNGFVLRDIRRKQWQHLTDDTAIQKALVILEDNYWIVSKMQISTEKGGRPTTRYFISQKLKTSIPPTAKTAETQKTNNSDIFFEKKLGFGSFGSTTLDTFESLKNVDMDSTLNDDFFNSANSQNWDATI